MPKKVVTAYDEESENAILSRVLDDRESAIKAINQLDSSDFFQPHCKEIMSVIEQMRERSIEISQSAIFAFVLERQSDLTLIKPSHLVSLINSELKNSTTDDQYYINKIKQWRYARDVAQAAEDITKCYQDPERLQIAMQRMRELDVTFNEEDVRLPGPDLEHVVQDIFGKVTRIPPIMSAIEGIDEIIEGFVLGRMTVVGARPGVGKSALATQLMLEALVQSYPCYFLSLEMSQIILMQRMISQITHLSLSQLKNKDVLTDQHLDMVINAQRHMHNMRYVIDDTRKSPIRKFEGKIVKAGQKLGQNIKFLIVDYLQLLASNAPGKDRQEQVAFVAEYLTDLAKKLNLHVLALAQLNRESDKRASRPKASDLRESGVIEQFADHIILIHREKNSVSGIFDIVKNRHGKTGEVGFTYYGEYLEFR